MSSKRLQIVSHGLVQPAFPLAPAIAMRPCLRALLTGRGRAAHNQGPRADAKFTALVGRAILPTFVPVVQVTLKKRLDVEGAARRGAARLPGLVLRAWRD
jgi:hypothetical protein